MKNYFKCLIIVLVIIFLDQFSKLWVHYHMRMGSPGQIRLLGNWFKLYYVLNPGMAFGIRLVTQYGKMILTIGRIVASIFIARYIYIASIANNWDAIWGKLVSWSFILGGAIGNVIDSVFYGIFLDNAPEGSICKLFHGQVIDMIFFDIYSYKVPGWVPCFGNTFTNIFPIFNIADVFITLGVLLMIILSHIERKV